MSNRASMIGWLTAFGLLGVLALRAAAHDDATPNKAEDESTTQNTQTNDDAGEAETADQKTPVTIPADEAAAPAYDRYDALLASLTIFVLAVFVGFEVITKVPPTLHTPLMSGSNAISGITIVGAILATGFGTNWFVAFVGMIALALAAINVVGGFLVTHRMLEMFKRKK